MSYPGRSPSQWAGNSSQNDGQPASKVVEKSAAGIVGTVKAKSHKKLFRRPKRCPARGLKERRSRLPRNNVIASGESYRRKLVGWDESAVGEARNGAPVITLRPKVSIRHYGLKRADLICRTAVYVIRTHGGVGGRGREASSYPDSVSRRPQREESQ